MLHLPRKEGEKDRKRKTESSLYITETHLSPNGDWSKRLHFFTAVKASS